MRRLTAFSLAELLIVIGIITLLVGILIPVISMARQRANQTRCLSNLGQLATAFINYANENEGRFPRPGANGFAQPEDWVYWQPGRPFNQSRIYPYLRNAAEVLTCPSDDPLSHTRRSPNLYPYSYSVNFLVCTLGPAKTLTLAQIVNSSDKILAIDESASTVDDGAWAWQSTNGLGPMTKANPNQGHNLLSIRHENRNEDVTNLNAGNGNAGFCDGHAAIVGRRDSFTPRYYDPSYR